MAFPACYFGRPSAAELIRPGAVDLTCPWPNPTDRTLRSLPQPRALAFSHMHMNFLIRIAAAAALIG